MTTEIQSNGRWAIRIAALSLGLALAGCGAAGLTGGANGTSGSPTPSAVVPTDPTASPTPRDGVSVAALTQMVEQAALGDGDPGVRVADAVLTTRQAAVTLISGSQIGTNEAVYLVQLVGHFTLNDVSIPQNGHAPTGTALSFDIDVSSGDAVDTGLGDKVADLSTLGPVIVLHL